MDQIHKSDGQDRIIAKINELVKAHNDLVEGKTIQKTKWRVIGQVLIAIIGLLGTGIAVWAQVKTDSNSSALEGTVNQFNTRTVPLLEKTIQEQREYVKKLTEVVSSLRERLAHLEGRYEGRSRLVEIFSSRPEPEKEKLRTLMGRRASRPIPKLDIRQAE